MVRHPSHTRQQPQKPGPAAGLKEAPQAKRCDAIYAQGDDAGQTDKTDKPTAMARALEQLLGRR